MSERIAVQGSKNRALGGARTAREDEFYTQLPDIERELKHYRKQFSGKTVYCNCDDPRVSEFFHYFSYNFEKLKLKKLITTCYRNLERDLFSQHDSERALFLEYDGDKDGDKVPGPDEIGVRTLEGDGDFRSPETIELLKQADIVVTNPPFSLFREYVAQLIEHDKKFLIMGGLNNITNREVFKLIQENKLWLGHNNGDMKFKVPDHYEPRSTRFWVDETGQKWRSFGTMAWYTNLDVSKRHEDLILYKNYDPDEFQKFENFDAINVGKLSDIPVDYPGAMGVPITFVDKYNPDQFEILGIGIAGLGLEAGVEPFKPEHKEHRRKVQKKGAVDGDLYLVIDGVPEVPYRRILIRNKRL